MLYVQGVFFMKCKDCGFEFFDDKRYCPNCGSNHVIEQDKCVSPQSDRTDYYHKYYGTNNIRIEKRNIPLCILLSIITCGIYSIYWAYKCGQKIDLIHSRFSKSENDYHTVIYTLLMVFGFNIVVLALLQHEMNNEVERMFTSEQSKKNIYTIARLLLTDKCIITNKFSIY